MYGSTRAQRLTFTISIVVAATCFASPVEAQVITERGLFEWVEGISGRDREGRRDYIRDVLTGMDITFMELPFDSAVVRGRVFSGVNIQATLGKGKRKVFVGAHYDAVEGSPGSNDNGAGVAVLLGLLSSLREHPLTTEVSFVFFDREEDGLIGSHVYAREAVDTSRYLAMINMDVVGMGTELYAGPVGGGDDDVIMPIMRQAAASIGVRLGELPDYPGSDHLSFAGAGLENISLSILPEGDAEKVLAMLNGEKMTGETAPEVMQTMHTPRDGPETVSGKAMMIMYTFVREVLLFTEKSGAR